MDKNIWVVDSSDEELAKIMGLSIQTIKKYNKSLIEKGYLKIIKTDDKEIKQFNLNDE